MQAVTLRSRQTGLSKLVILLILLVIILIGSGTTLALYFAGVFEGGATADEQLAEGELEGELVEGEQAPQEPVQPPKYLPMEPPLVVNFERNGRLGYLQVNLQMMVRGQEALNNVMAHMPVLRDGILMLLSSKTYQDVKDRAGKEALRAEALVEINRLLEEREVVDRVEAVYFTGFVMQ